MNYANPDTIAHTADYNAGLEAVRIIDREIGRVLKVAQGADALIAITGDHGNMEEMINPMTGLPESQHDPSPVPFYLMGEEFRGGRFINQDSLAMETLRFACRRCTDSARDHEHPEAARDDGK